MVECIAWAPESATAAIREATSTSAGENSTINNSSAKIGSSTAALNGPFLASGSRDKTIKVSSKMNKNERQGFKISRKYYRC